MLQKNNILIHLSSKCQLPIIYIPLTERFEMYNNITDNVEHMASLHSQFNSLRVGLKLNPVLCEHLLCLNVFTPVLILISSTNLWLFT